MKHCAGCPSLPEHMNTKIGSSDELPCYSESINDGLSENEVDNIDGEFDNNTSTSDSVPDMSDDFVTPDSPKNPNHGDRIHEVFEWNNKESEAREPPGNSFTSQEQCQSFSSTTPLTMKSSSATSLQRVVIIEDTDFMGVMNKGGADLSQSEPEQSGATLAANKNQDVSSTFVVPHEAEIIDLSTPSPSCRSVLDRKNRRVSSSVGTDFIDLTNSPNFIQL